MEIVKDKLVRLPRHTGSVESTMRRLNREVIDNCWKKIIIVGIDGNNHYKQLNSNMTNETSIGLLEVGKDMIVRSMYD